MKCIHCENESAEDICSTGDFTLDMLVLFVPDPKVPPLIVRANYTHIKKQVINRPIDDMPPTSPDKTIADLPTLLGYPVVETPYPPWGNARRRIFFDSLRSDYANRRISIEDDSSCIEELHLHLYPKPDKDKNNE